jgi:hypothetical protein
MRIASIVLCIALLSTSAIAQITMTSGDVQTMYGAGKSWRQVSVNTSNTSMNVGTASSSAQTWALPALKYSDSLRADFLAPSATPYSSSYSRATTVRRSIISSGGFTVTLFEYMRITTDSLIDLGNVSRSQGQGIDTTTFDKSYRLEVPLPLFYGLTNVKRDSTSSGGGIYTIQQTNQVVDAFGSITTPVGTYQVLRMKETQITRNVFPGFPATVDTSVSFTWVAKEGVLASVDASSSRQISGTIPIHDASYQYINTAVGIANSSPSLPGIPALNQNYPNPFNPTTTISYELPVGGNVTLNVYDILGKQVARLVDGNQSAGHHTVTFDGSSLRSGVYFYRIQNGTFVDSKKFILIK